MRRSFPQNSHDWQALTANSPLARRVPRWSVGIAQPPAPAQLLCSTRSPDPNARITGSRNHAPRSIGDDRLHGRVRPADRLPQAPLRMNATWPTIARNLTGNRLDQIGRHGKRLLLRFSNRRILVIEPRMTGLLLIDGEPGTEHLRFELRLQGGDCNRLAYWDRRGLGQVFLLDETGLQDYLSPGRIGPDALTITPAELRENLRHRRIPVKVGLLDQKAVAGIGNIYASEILHLAGIDPRRRCCRISRSQWQAIHEQMLVVLTTAIRYEGSTLADGTWRTALNRPGDYQNHHRVYDRQAEPCPRCGQGPVRRIVQAQRATYFCGRCQK